MHQIDHPTAVSGRFIEGSPPTPPATVVTDDWANSIQEEIVNVVINTKVIPATTLSKPSEVQLRDVLQTNIKQQGPGIGYLSGFWSKVDAFDSDTVKVSNGSARFIDSLSIINLTLSAAFGGGQLKKRITKSGQSVWTAGDDNRMLPSTVSLTKQWYYLFVIAKESGGVITLDIGMDTSIIASNLIAESGFRWHRRIGAFNIYNDTGTGFPIPFRSMGTKFYFTHFKTNFGVSNIHNSTEVEILAGTTFRDTSPFVPPGINSMVGLRISNFRTDGAIQLNQKFWLRVQIDNDSFDFSGGDPSGNVAHTWDSFVETDGAGLKIEVSETSKVEIWLGTSNKIRGLVSLAPTGNKLQFSMDTVYYFDPIGTDGLN